MLVEFRWKSSIIGQIGRLLEFGSEFWVIFDGVALATSLMALGGAGNETLS